MKLLQHFCNYFLSEENKLIRRRLNRVIQENIEITTELKSLQSARLIAAVSPATAAPIIQRNDPFDMTIINDLASTVDDVKTKCNVATKDVILYKEHGFK